MYPNSNVSLSECFLHLVSREIGDHMGSSSNCDGRSVTSAVGTDIAKLADALAQAQSIIQAAGINPNSGTLFLRL